MTYFPDLDPFPDFGTPESSLAVGWLEPDHPYPPGSIEVEVLEKLVELFRDPWGPSGGLGYHTCGWCEPDAESQDVLLNDDVLGKRNLRVPGEGSIFVSPELILHYITAHHYLPPLEFREAVRRCPPMRSRAYFEAIQRLGPPGVDWEIALAEPDRETLLEAPVEICFDGRQLLLSTEFKARISDRVCFGVVRAWEKDQQMVPEPWNLDRVWLVSGADVWTTYPGRAPGPRSPHEILAYVEEGPAWGGCTVQVIARVQGGTRPGQIPQRLRAADQRIP